MNQRPALTAVWPLLTACLIAMAMAPDVSAQPQYPESYLRYAGDPQKRGEAADRTPPQLRQVTFKQRLGEPLPLDARLRDESGKTVALGDYFKAGVRWCSRSSITAARCCARR